MFSVTTLIPAIHQVSLITLFFVSLRTSNSKICARSLQQEPRRRVNWDNDILSSEDLKTGPPKLSFYTQPSYTVSQSTPYTGGFDSDKENVPILTSSDDHPNTDYGVIPQGQIPVNH